MTNFQDPQSLTERRTRIRIDVSLPVSFIAMEELDLDSDKPFFKGEICNLSSGGMCLEIPQELHLGSKISFKINLSNEQITGVARVIYSNMKETDIKDFIWTIGFAFEYFYHNSQDKLDSFLQTFLENKSD